MAAGDGAADGVPATTDREADGEAATADSRTVLGLIVVFGLGLRFALADKTSYWLDELFSVEDYVLGHATVFDALGALADTSIHPPVYQFLLYFWVELFGSHEVATRTLSSLAIALTTVALHQLVRRFHGAATANAAALLFTLSFAAVHYGTETRSYALTLLLSVLSSLAAHRYLEWLSSVDGARRMLPSLPTMGLVAVNAALLLTHYYNLFFWAAQAAFVLIVAVVGSRTGRRLGAASAVVASYVLQLIVFFVVWGDEAYGSFTKYTYAGVYAVESPANDALGMFAALSDQALALGTVASGAIVLAAAGALVIGHRRSRPGLGARNASGPTVGGFYAVWMTLVPALVTYATFLLIDAERFSPRYLLFLVPHMIVVVTVGASWGLCRVLPHRLPPRSGVDRVWATVALGLAVALGAPGLVRAVQDQPADWRGTARDIVAMVEATPELQFVIYQTSFRSRPMIDYYLRRFSDGEVTATDVISLRDESRGLFAFERQPDQLQGADRLVVVFAHHRTDEFPTALERLEQTYDVHVRIVKDGRGFIVFDVSGHV